MIRITLAVLLLATTAHAGSPPAVPTLPSQVVVGSATAATNGAAIQGMWQALAAQIAAMQPASTSGGTPPLAGNPPPVNGSAPLSLPAGTYTTFGLFAADSGIAITGASEAGAIVTGQGGCPASNNQIGATGCSRLTYGKGAAYLQVPATLSTLTVENAGTLCACNGDGQAGVYVDGAAWASTSPGTVSLANMLVENNEDGVFGSQGTVPVTLQATGSYWHGNGQGASGYAHDIYWNAGPVVLTNDVFDGTSLGNDVKVKGLQPAVTISGGWFGNFGQGPRWLDLPDGGTISATGATFDLDPGSSGGNVLGFGEEAAPAAGAPCGGTISGGAMWIGRPAYISVAAGCALTFSGVAQHWTNASAYITVQGGGTVTGLVLTPPAGATIETAPQPPVMP